MTNLCARCNQTHPMDRMLTIVNAWGQWEDLCEDRVTLSDRVIDTMYDEED